MNNGNILVGANLRETHTPKKLCEAQSRQDQFVSEIAVRDAARKKAFTVGQVKNKQTARCQHAKYLIRELESLFFVEMLKHVECKHYIATLWFALREVALYVALFNRVESETMRGFYLLRRTIDSFKVVVSRLLQPVQETAITAP